MDQLRLILSIIIYVLLIIILIVGVIFFIRLIKTLKKVDKAVDGVNEKVGSLNSFFVLIDFTTDKLVNASDKMIDVVYSTINKVVGTLTTTKRLKKDDEE